MTTEKCAFLNDAGTTTAAAVRNLGRAVRTILVTPSHPEAVHISMKALRLAPPVAVQPEIAAVTTTVRNTLQHQADRTKLQPMNNKQLLTLAAVLIQFTDHIPAASTNVQTPYRHIGNLYGAVTGTAARTAEPLDFPGQLSISLAHHDGDVPLALWHLFLASRFFARRRDGVALSDGPVIDAEEKLASMLEWQNSLAACVPYDHDGYQDAAGDTYYAWTHALAKVAFTVLPEHSNRITSATATLFDAGTHIMQAYVNRAYPEGRGATARNHAKAAQYGNAIGQVCVDFLTDTSDQS